MSTMTWSSFLLRATVGGPISPARERSAINTGLGTPSVIHKIIKIHQPTHSIFFLRRTTFKLLHKDLEDILNIFHKEMFNKSQARNSLIQTPP
jgi:hypothetical protein